MTKGLLDCAKVEWIKIHGDLAKAWPDTVMARSSQGETPVKSNADQGKIQCPTSVIRFLRALSITLGQSRSDQAVGEDVDDDKCVRARVWLRPDKGRCQPDPLLAKGDPVSDECHCDNLMRSVVEVAAQF